MSFFSNTWKTSVRRLLFETLGCGLVAPNYVTIYVQVDDVQGYLTDASKLGGKMLVPPTEVPGMGYFAWLADPDGNIIGLWKPV